MLLKFAMNFMHPLGGEYRRLLYKPDFLLPAGGAMTVSVSWYVDVITLQQLTCASISLYIVWWGWILRPLPVCAAWCVNNLRYQKSICNLVQGLSWDLWWPPLVWMWSIWNFGTCKNTQNLKWLTSCPDKLIDANVKVDPYAYQIWCMKVKV